MIADDRARCRGLQHPFGRQAFRKFALCVFKVKHQPLMAAVESPLYAHYFHLAQITALSPGDALIQPQACAHLQGAASAVLIEQEKKMDGLHQVRAFAQQSFAFADGFPDQIEFAMFQVAQAAVNNAGGSAGPSRAEVVLLNQQGAPSGASALARDRDSIDPSTNDNYMKVLAF